MITIPTILFFAYVLYVCISFGIPDSLSQSYYLLKPVQKILFSAVMVFIPIFLMVSLFSRVHDAYTLALITPSAISIVFVGIFALYEDKFQRWFHFIGAFLSAALTIIWSFIIYKHTLYIFLPLALSSIIIPLVTNKKKFTFWLEMGCFTSFFVVANIVYYL